MTKSLLAITASGGSGKRTIRLAAAIAVLALAEGGAADAPAVASEPAAREEAIKHGISLIDAELKQYGNGTREGWAESLKAFRESLKADRDPTKGFRFSREGRAMLLADRLQDTPECARAFDAIVHATKEFEKIGIDLMVVFIPNKIAAYPDYAADNVPEHRMVMMAEKR